MTNAFWDEKKNKKNSAAKVTLNSFFPLSPLFTQSLNNNVMRVPAFYMESQLLHNSVSESML